MGAPDRAAGLAVQLNEAHQILASLDKQIATLLDSLKQSDKSIAEQLRQMRADIRSVAGEQTTAMQALGRDVRRMAVQLDRQQAVIERLRVALDDAQQAAAMEDV